MLVYANYIWLLAFTLELYRIGQALIGRGNSIEINRAENR